MKVVKFTVANGREIYVNVDQILKLYESNDPEHTMVSMCQVDQIANRQRQFEVKGNVHEIAAMLNEGCGGNG